MFRNSFSFSKSGIKRMGKMTVYMVRYNSRVTKCNNNFFDLNVLQIPTDILRPPKVFFDYA